jgi:hypothetical protein
VKTFPAVELKRVLISTGVLIFRLAQSAAGPLQYPPESIRKNLRPVNNPNRLRETCAAADEDRRRADGRGQGIHPPA